MQQKKRMPIMKEIAVLARGSPLSKRQVAEVLEEIRAFSPEVSFRPHYIETKGDRDKKSSLRVREKSNFFTVEIDELQKRKRGYLAIHSAKDLPEPLPEHLCIAALTKGVTSRDALVFRKGEGLAEAKVIATSSLQREERVKALKEDVTIVDIRGTIEERLLQLEEGLVDGVVIAEAALIRLGLIHVNRIDLPGKTAEGQGQLALVVHKEDRTLQEFLAPLDIR